MKREQTKYYIREYDRDKMEFTLTEIPLNKDNWHYAQIDATIRTSFLKYGCPLPKCVIVQELKHFITIKIIRDDIKEKDLLKWYDTSLYIKSDLDIQAKCNSTSTEDTEEWIEYKFEII